MDGSQEEEGRVGAHAGSEEELLQSLLATLESMQRMTIVDGPHKLRAALAQLHEIRLSITCKISGPHASCAGSPVSDALRERYAACLHQVERLVARMSDVLAQIDHGSFCMARVVCPCHGSTRRYYYVPLPFRASSFTDSLRQSIEDVFGRFAEACPATAASLLEAVSQTCSHQHLHSLGRGGGLGPFREFAMAAVCYALDWFRGQHAEVDGPPSTSEPTVLVTLPSTSGNNGHGGTAASRASVHVVNQTNHRGWALIHIVVALNDRELLVHIVRSADECGIPLELEVKGSVRGRRWTPARLLQELEKLELAAAMGEGRSVAKERTRAKDSASASASASSREDEGRMDYQDSRKRESWTHDRADDAGEATTAVFARTAETFNRLRSMRSTSTSGSAASAASAASSAAASPTTGIIPSAESSRPHSSMSLPTGPLSANDAASRHLVWKAFQYFGDDSNRSEDDYVTTVKFNHNGRMLAVGDRAGRICIFEQRLPQEPLSHPYSDYQFSMEFQSHELSFDCLKSVEIEERIQAIRWLPPAANCESLLSANERVVKLWSIHRRPARQRRLSLSPSGAKQQAAGPEPHANGAGGHGLELHTTCRHQFANGHHFHIHSISPCCDGETFLSADDLCVNLWSLRCSGPVYKIVDLRPPSMHVLTEVITSASFSPTDGHLLAYGTNTGHLHVADTRRAALHDARSPSVIDLAPPMHRSYGYYTELIRSISDVQFTVDGHYLASRDFLSLRVWDVRSHQLPVAEVAVHDYLLGCLPELFDNDCIFDRFTVDSSPCGSRLLTGSYNNIFLVFDIVTGQTTTVEAFHDGPELPQRRWPNVHAMHFAKKALYLGWHPRDNVLAIAGINKLYIYQATHHFA